MAGQGVTISAIANALEDSGWTVVFVCVPNTPHIGVVPIPIEGGSSNQRYPDVLSFKDGVLRLTEVEITLSEDVVQKTIVRFDEQVRALKTNTIWLSWSDRVLSLTGHHLPLMCTIVPELVICKNIRPSQANLIDRLASAGISVSDYSHFSA